MPKLRLGRSRRFRRVLQTLLILLFVWRATTEDCISVIASTKDVDALQACLSTGASADVSWEERLELSQPIVLNASNALYVTGAASGASIAGAGTTRLFEVADGSTLVLRSIELRNGSAADFGGAVTCSGESSIVLSNVTVADCLAVEGGGAVYLEKSCELSAGNGTKFIDNVSGALGGAIASTAIAPISLEDSEFSGNNASISGGAIYMFSGNLMDSALLSVSNCHFTSNRALGGLGGGLYAQNVTVSDSVFEKNAAKQFGGAIATFDVVGATAERCSFVGNSAAVDGGAIRGPIIDFQQLTPAMTTRVSQCNFTSNTAVRYGGSVYSSRVEAAECNFKSGASNRGGAIHTANVNVSDCVIFNCSAVTLGGGIFLDGGLGISFNAESTEISGNRALIAGGGVFSLSSELLTPLSSAVSFENNSAACCFNPTSKDLNSSCSDADFSLAGQACCPAGQRIDLNGGGCKPCEEGWNCSVPGLSELTMPLLPGYWKAQLVTLEAVKCFSGSACRGGVAESNLDELCSEGNEGPYCAVCSDGYYSSGRSSSCKSCDNSAQAGVAAVALLLLASFASLLWLVTWADPTGISDEAGNESNQGIKAAAVGTARVVAALPWEKMRIPLVALQIVVQYAAITGIRFPPIFEGFLHWMAALTLELGWLFSAVCVFSVTFYSRLLVVTLAPLCVTAVLAVSYAFSRWRAAGSEALLARTTRRHLMGLLVVTFFIYSSTSAVCFQTFACDDLGNGSSYLRADYSVDCNAPLHRSYSLYAGFMAILYAGGIPTLYLVLLWRHRKTLVAPKGSVTAMVRQGAAPELKPTRFLWHPYRSHCFYWEVVECGRRLLLTGALAFILPGSPGQAAVACLLAALTLATYAAFWPLEDRYDCYSYVLGCLIIFTAMFLGLVMDADIAANDDTSGTTLSVVVIVVTVLLVVFTILQIGLSAREAFQRVADRSLLGLSGSNNGRRRSAQAVGPSARASGRSADEFLSSKSNFREDTASGIFGANGGKKAEGAASDSDAEEEKSEGGRNDPNLALAA